MSDRLLHEQQLQIKAERDRQAARFPVGSPVRVRHNQRDAVVIGLDTGRCFIRFASENTGWFDNSDLEAA